MLRKLFTISLLLIFTLATSGVALYHCCCGISIVEDTHACCGSHKKCDTHLHYYKMDNVFQAVDKIEHNLVSLIISYVPFGLSFEWLLPKPEHSYQLSNAPPLPNTVELSLLQVFRL